LWFYLYFKFFNKDNTKWFEEFILEKTKLKKENSTWNWLEENKITENNKDFVDVDDPFSFKEDITTKEVTNTNISTASKEKVPDWLKASFDIDNSSNEDKTIINNEVNITQNITKTDSNIEQQSASTSDNTINDVTTKNDETDIPDWLKSSFDDSSSSWENTSDSTAVIENSPKTEIIPPTEKTSSDYTDDNSLDETDIPDWLKSSFDDSSSSWENTSDSTAVVEDSPKTEIIPPTEETSSDDTDDNSLDETNIPDWLKSSFDDSSSSWENTSDSTAVVEDSPKTEIIPPTEETSSDDTDDNSLDETNIPDWLKSSLDENDNSLSDDKSSNIKTSIDQNIPDWLKSSLNESPTSNNTNIPSIKGIDDSTKSEINTPELLKSNDWDKVFSFDDSSFWLSNNEVDSSKEKKIKKKSTKKTKSKIDDDFEEIKLDSSINIWNISNNVTKKEKIIKKPQTTDDKPKNKNWDELWDDWMDIPDWLNKNWDKK